MQCQQGFAGRIKGLSMPRILTHSEFENLSKNVSSNRESVAPPTQKPTPSPIKNGKRYNVPIKEFYFMHPDNSENYKISGEFIIDVNGKMIEIPIIEGILKTTDEKVKNALISKGIIFTHEKEVENEQ